MSLLPTDTTQIPHSLGHLAGGALVSGTVGVEEEDVVAMSGE